MSQICPDCNTPYTGRSCRCGYGGSNREEKPKNHNCAAFGCPLAGSITGSVGGGEGRIWYCRFHFGKTPDENDAITVRIKSGALLREEELGREETKRRLQEKFGGPAKKAHEQEPT